MSGISLIGFLGHSFRAMTAFLFSSLLRNESGTRYAIQWNLAGAPQMTDVNADVCKILLSSVWRMRT